ALPRLLLRRLAALLHPRPFPTRRSSDLARLAVPRRGRTTRPAARAVLTKSASLVATIAAPSRIRRATRRSGSRFCARARSHSGRSEEHTSELQSRFELVCRLLLETKKPH